MVYLICWCISLFFLKVFLKTFPFLLNLLRFELNSLLQNVQPLFPPHYRLRIYMVQVYIEILKIYQLLIN